MLVKKSFIILIIMVFVTSCATDEFGNKRSLTDTERGAIIGGAIGAVLGLTQSRNKGKKAVLYGLVGGISGAAVGNYMDSQKRDFEKQLRDEIGRGDIYVEKHPGDVLMITMTSQTAFEVNSTRIKANFQSTLNKIAKIVNRYGKTQISLVGHTDSTGSAAYNKQLSERRADAVHQYLLDRNVIPQRLTTYGMGEERPRTENNTAEGRRLNRRVEVVIEPVVSG